MSGILFALGGSLLVGWLAYRFREHTVVESVRVASIAALTIFGLWLLRPLLTRLWKWAFRLAESAVKRWGNRRETGRSNSRRTTPERKSRTLADLQRLTPRDFEELCAEIAVGWGYDARASGATGDGGVDVEMWRNGEYSVGQCKRYTGTVPISEVRDFYGAMMHVGAVRGFFFTTGRFSDGARDFVRGKPIELLDGESIARIQEYQMSPVRLLTRN